MSWQQAHLKEAKSNNLGISKVIVLTVPRTYTRQDKNKRGKISTLRFRIDNNKNSFLKEAVFEEVIEQCLTTLPEPRRLRKCRKDQQS